RVATSSFRLQPVIEECLATIEPTIDPSRVQVTADVAANLPDLVQDERKLKRIVINLMSNAVKFTERGTIAVTARRRGDAVEIAVADTGIGIAEAFLGRIFEEFERVEPRGERPREGTGLGLAICRRFAALMGGEVTVRSRPGEGSAFTLTAPLVHPSSVASLAGTVSRPTAGKDGAAATDAAVDGQGTVLVVDDSKAN